MPTYLAHILTCLRRSLQMFGSDTKAQAEGINRALDQQSSSFRTIDGKLEQAKQLVSSGNGLITKLIDRVDWFKGLATEFKRHMHQIIAGNVAIYREVLAIRSSFTIQVDRLLCEDPFILEDGVCSSGGRYENRNQSIIRLL
jgi:hypothetical protein